MYKNIIFDMSEVIITGIHGVEKDIESNFGILADEYEKRRLEVNSLFLDVMRGKRKKRGRTGVELSLL